MDSATELILKNRARFAGRSTLIIGCPSVGAVDVLQSDLDDPLYFLHRDFSVYSRFQTSSSEKLRHQFGVWLDTNGASLDSVLLYMPKGKELLELTLAAISTLNAVEVYVAGAKRTGIESADRVLKSTFGSCRKVDSARHAVMLVSPLGESERGLFAAAEFQQQFTLDQNDVSLRVVSLPGVFSHGRLDDGTRRLLDCIGAKINGSILDFGCGCGTIGAVIARLAPESEVHLIDSDAMAIASTQATVETNNLKNTQCYPSDLFNEVSTKFDLIVSNPTFHQGNQTDQRMVTGLIADSGRYLNAGGSLIIVANGFLPYHTLLTQQFKIVRTLSRDSRYSVYLANQPKELN